MMRRRKILVVDDEKGVRDIIKLALDATGEFEVRTAHSGMDGIYSARVHKPDIIILDICMPGMNGFEVLKRLKEDENTVSIPVIIYSGLADDESKCIAMELYNEAYLTKPFDMFEMIDMVRTVLKRKYPEQ